MTLTQLEYVLAVDKHQHFGRAAESCFVTQPTLSMQIHKLEDELQITLFDRSKNPIQTTVEGKVVIDQARVVIKEQNRLVSLASETQNDVTGEFKLAVIPTLSPYLIPLFIKDFNKQYPKVNLQIFEYKTDDIIEMLKIDELDAGLLATPLHEKNLAEKVLYYEPFYLFINSKHEFLKKNKIKEDQLDINEIWLLNKGNCFRDQVLKICAHTKSDTYNTSLNFQSGNFETLKNMVTSSGGYTILPHMAVEQLSNSMKKYVRPFYSPVPTREISLVTNKDSLKTKVIRALELEILAAIPDEIRSIKKKDLQIIEFDIK